jgi:hypothetical protein
LPSNCRYPTIFFGGATIRLEVSPGFVSGSCEPPGDAAKKWVENMSESRISSDLVGTQPAETLEGPQRHPSLTVRSFGLTDRGKIRDTNEDQFLIAVLVKALQIQLTSLP